MMAAYQPTPGGIHPGLPHGHPMAPNPGQQHMGQPMMQPGMSGAPHVSQPGVMVGMQPGAHGMGPTMGGQHPGGMPMQAQMGGQSMAGGMPHQGGVSHMTPQQQMMQQQMAANPQLAQQQQHIMRMRQQHMMQQAQANGMMGMHQGVPINSQQLAQLQQLQQQQQQHAQQQGVQGGNPSVQLPAHLQMQQQALHQQRIQQQQAAQQQQQQAQIAQQMAMQHSQQSNPGQSAQPNQQAQSNNPQQMRPQSRMANPNEQGQQNQPQQHSQPGQAQQGQAQAQQTPQPGQPANPQQPGQSQLSVQQQRQQYLLLQRQQQTAIQQARMQAAVQQQSQGQHPGMFILRLLNFSDHLANFGEASGKEITNWHNFVDKHFASDGRIIHSFESNNLQSGSRGRKDFEVLRPTVARYFWTYFDSGCSSVRLHTEQAREVPHSSGGQSVLCQNATFSVSYPNGARLEMMGSLQVLFQAGTDSIECLQFQTATTEEIVSRTQIDKVLSDWSPSLPTKSPKMAKNKLPKAQAKMQEQQERLTLDHFPKTPKGTYGITSKVQQFLEIGETMNIMSDLMHYAQEKKMRPEHALEALNQQYEAAERNGQGGNPQINLPPNGVAQGNRTPSMQHQMLQNGQPGTFSSPSVSNLNLPMQNGNPGNLAPNMNMPNSHTPSPHQSNMAAPPMLPQHSQQGTNSSAASANTSPNINNNNNKRRRSTVKTEGEDGGGADGQGGANRIKPSPRMSKKAKP